MNIQKTSLKPQDIFLLLKLISLNRNTWNQMPVAEELAMSQSEVSESVARSKNSGLLAFDGKNVNKMALMEFLEHGIQYVYPQKPGPVLRGIPTSHSASPLKEYISSTEVYVWPYSKGTVRGHSIIPIYPSVPQAALRDPIFYELLALTDALRAGRVREKQLAVKELRKRLRLDE